MIFRKWFFYLLIFSLTSYSFANPPLELALLKDAYPNQIQEVYPHYIAWTDGSRMPVRSSSHLLEWLAKFLPGTKNSISVKDLKCDNYEYFFRKMYGSTPEMVKQNLVTIYWMPNKFGKQYPLHVTTINGIDKKIMRISAELEKLPPADLKYLEKPAGSYYWRNVKKERYLSSHSFGIAIDINSKNANYWLWDLEKGLQTGKQLKYHNNVPMRIVEIFEKEGFLWGGRWYFYDTMHFEYRPEMFVKDADANLRYNNLIGLRC